MHLFSRYLPLALRVRVIFAIKGRHRGTRRRRTCAKEKGRGERGIACAQEEGERKNGERERPRVKAERNIKKHSAPLSKFT